MPKALLVLLVVQLWYCMMLYLIMLPTYWKDVGDLESNMSQQSSPGVYETKFSFGWSCPGSLTLFKDDNGCTCWLCWKRLMSEL